MTLTFTYKGSRRPDGTEVQTPSIPVVFSGGASFQTLALLDSGADISAMPQKMAEALGLETTAERKTAYGVGGAVDSVNTHARILVERGHERYWFDLPIKIILGDHDFPVLLGRTGFFDKFIISFDQAREKIHLKRNNAATHT